MKKALVLLLALSMVFGVFADEPVANVNVSEFSGEASVTWGVDLDAERTGFSNSAKATLKLNLLDGGDKASTGEGVWGEIKIKTDGDTFAKAEGDDALYGGDHYCGFAIDLFDDGPSEGSESGGRTCGIYK